MEGDVALQAGGVNQALTDWEQQYLVHAVDRLFTSCKPEDSNEQVVIPQQSPNVLLVNLKDGHRRVIHGGDGEGNSGSLGIDRPVGGLEGELDNARPIGGRGVGDHCVCNSQFTSRFSDRGYNGIG